MFALEICDVQFPINTLTFDMAHGYTPGIACNFYTFGTPLKYTTDSKLNIETKTYYMQSATRINQE